MFALIAAVADQDGIVELDCLKSFSTRDMAEIYKTSILSEIRSMWSLRQKYIEDYVNSDNIVIKPPYDNLSFHGYSYYQTLDVPQFKKFLCEFLLARYEQRFDYMFKEFKNYNPPKPHQLHHIQNNLQILEIPNG